MEQILNDMRATMPRDAVLPHPRNAAPDEDYPSIHDAQAFKAYYEREGFIVVRNAVPRSLCDAARHAFLSEVLPDKSSLFLRHESGTYDRHVFTEAGFMKYPIMNIQDLSGKKFPHFKRLGLDLLTQPTIQRAVQNLFGEPGMAIHTMYFDGNQTTWAHRDSHYIDSEPAGKMVGIWVAAEDIQPGAGRFYIVPGSHRTSVPGEQDDPNGAAYKLRMAEFVKNGPADCVAPVMKQGDMLLWACRTVHGSLPTSDQQCSRRSFTAHYIPRSHRIQWQGGVIAAPAETVAVNGVAVMLHGTESSVVRHIKSILRSYPSLYKVARDIKRRFTLDRNKNDLLLSIGTAGDSQAAWEALTVLFR
jgi:phytanoyl-CoA hydroxylase